MVRFLKADVLILGGGVAGISAAFFIREIDKKSKIIIVDKEETEPYPRAPITYGLEDVNFLNKLRFAKKVVSDPETKFLRGTEALGIDSEEKKVKIFVHTNNAVNSIKD